MGFCHGARSPLICHSIGYRLQGAQITQQQSSPSIRLHDTAVDTPPIPPPSGVGDPPPHPDPGPHPGASPHKRTPSNVQAQEVATASTPSSSRLLAVAPPAAQADAAEGGPVSPRLTRAQAVTHAPGGHAGTHPGAPKSPQAAPPQGPPQLEAAPRFVSSPRQSARLTPLQPTPAVTVTEARMAADSGKEHRRQSARLSSQQLSPMASPHLSSQSALPSSCHKGASGAVPPPKQSGGRGVPSPRQSARLASAGPSHLGLSRSEGPSSSPDPAPPLPAGEVSSPDRQQPTSLQATHSQVGTL